MTVWKPVARAPGYEVSDDGRVRRIAGYRCRETRVLKLRKITDGYLAAHLCVGGRRFNGPVHQLVCEAFHGPKPTASHQVAHADGNPANNKAGNLRWATVAENAADRVAHGTALLGERNPKSKLTDKQVAEIRESLEPSTALANKYGVSRNQIWRIRTGQFRKVTDLRREAEAA